MKDRVFFDTNILAYSFDATDHGKYEVASDLIVQAYQKGDVVISTQVLKEFYQGFRLYNHSYRRSIT